ncbi:MAG: trypsin-like peptidase domain-containing protein [Oscillospiraceae bacterium]|nr:trypsin-like peptidase domain-containing protein [Oscillospiraceae bacterium]
MYEENENNQAENIESEEIINDIPENTEEETSESKIYKKLRKTMIGAIAFCCAISLVIGGIGGIIISKNANKVQNTSSQADSGIDVTVSRSGNSEISGIAVLDIKTSNNESAGTSVSDVAAKVENSVVAINVTGIQSYSGLGGQRKYTVTSSGSGVIISEDGYIVTNHHVIEGATKITIILCSGEQYEAKIVAADEKNDIAVLKIEISGAVPAVFGDSDKIILGETAIAIGNPLGTFGGSVTAGVISGLNREIKIESSYLNLLQTDAAINPGNSGGGLFNDRGELIGIVNAKSTGTNVEGIGFAIPSNDVKKIVEDLVSFGYVKGRPDKGFEIIEINSTMMAMMYRVDRIGVYVYSITEGNNAYNAGLRVGDCIANIDGYEISSESDIEYIMNSKAVGDSIKLTVIRDGKNVDISWNIEEYIPSGAVAA